MPMTSDQLSILNGDLVDQAIQIQLHGPNHKGMWQAPRSRGCKARVDFEKREIVINSTTHGESRIPAGEFSVLHIMRREDQLNQTYGISWVRLSDGNYKREEFPLP